MSKVILRFLFNFLLQNHINFFQNITICFLLAIKNINNNIDFVKKTFIVDSNISKNIKTLQKNQIQIQKSQIELSKSILQLNKKKDENDTK